MRAAMLALLATVTAFALSVTTASAQTSSPWPVLSEDLQIRVVAGVGTTWFTAAETFDAVLGDSRGQDFGGGVSLTQGPAYIDITARRFSKSGQRVFVSDGGQVFPLGIATDVTMTPLEVAAGWRFRPRFGRLVPHLGVGYTRLRYEETSDFADEDDNVSAWFNGFHVIGGVEVRATRWIGFGADVVWTSIPDGLGDGGASQAFGERNLGGTSVRLNVIVGR